jgi:hypothetical protein
VSSQAAPCRAGLGPGRVVLSYRVLVAAAAVSGRRPAASQFPGARAVSSRGSRALSTPAHGPSVIRAHGPSASGRTVPARAMSDPFGAGEQSVSTFQVGEATHLLRTARSGRPASVRPSQAWHLRRGECVLRLRPLARVNRPAWHHSDRDCVSDRAGTDNSSLASPV